MLVREALPHAAHTAYIEKSVGLNPWRNRVISVGEGGTIVRMKFSGINVQVTPYKLSSCSQAMTEIVICHINSVNLFR